MGGQIFSFTKRGPSVVEKLNTFSARRGKEEKVFDSYSRLRLVYSGEIKWEIYPYMTVIFYFTFQNYCWFLLYSFKADLTWAHCTKAFRYKRPYIERTP